MVKKTTPQAKQAQVAASQEKKSVTKDKREEVKVEEPVENIQMAEVGDEESWTVKQKKENAQRFLKSVKKMNGKVKSSLERKQIVKAVQALQAYSLKKKQEGASKTQNLLEDEEQFF